jgi:hypothetical protein
MRFEFHPTPRQMEWLLSESKRLGITKQELLRRILDKVIDKVAPPVVKESPEELYEKIRKFASPCVPPYPFYPVPPVRIPDGVYLYAAPSPYPGDYSGRTVSVLYAASIIEDHETGKAELHNEWTLTTAMTGDPEVGKFVSATITGKKKDE